MSIFTLKQPEVRETPDVASIQINQDNVHSKSAFELRQWLVREKEFNEADFTSINEKTLMQKVVQVLLKRQEAALKAKEDKRIKAEESG